MNRIEHEGILAIFLAEAEEIVQRLSEQLTELRYGYDGQRILDDIHRGFHTLHGGAAVLDLAELSECALLSERLMERLRTGRLSLSPAVASLISNVVKVIEVMLARRVNNQAPEFMSRELQQRLTRAAAGKNNAVNAFEASKSAADPVGLYFDGRLRARKPEAANGLVPAAIVSPNVSEGITDDEFEILLDSLYGEGRGPTSRRVNVHDQDPSNVAVATATLARALNPNVVNTGAQDHRGISHLVQELCWVRNRLMRFQGREKNTELDKALSYLDLVAQDMDAWLIDRVKSG